jgi:hypothetical protein
MPPLFAHPFLPQLLHHFQPADFFLTHCDGFHFVSSEGDIKGHFYFELTGIYGILKKA